MGLHNGFEYDEIEKALAELTADDSSKHIDEFAFVKYLNMLKKFDISQQKSSKNDKKSSGGNNKQEALKKSAQTKLTLSPSIVGLEPASKKLNIAQDVTSSNECLVIDYIPNPNTQPSEVKSSAKPSTSNTQSVAMATTSNAKQTQSEKALNEYANMVSAQKFNEENEKLDKAKRLSKLISAMPDDQKLTALHHVNTYRTATSNNNNANNSSNANAAANASGKAAASILSQNTRSKFVYDPKVYQDNNIENFGVLFKNFAENSVLNQNVIKLVGSRDIQAATRPNVFSSSNATNVHSDVLQTRLNNAPDNMANNNNNANTNANNNNVNNDNKNNTNIITITITITTITTITTTITT